MIADKIENYGLYLGIGKNVRTALEYLYSTKFANLKAGRHDVDGDDVFALLNEYALKDASECRLEAHRKYIDVQYMAQGEERIGYAPFGGQAVAVDYDEKKDIMFFKDERAPAFIDFREGMFAVLFPNDLHMPGVGKGGARVRKVVVKARV